MAEKVTIGNAELWHGDCRELLPGLQGVDAIVTDPPYGIGYAHSGWSAPSVLNGQLVVAQTKTAKIEGDEVEFCPSFLFELYLPHGVSDTKNSPPIVLWGANHFARWLPPGGSFLCWDKSCGTGAADLFVDAEFAWSNRRNARNVFRLLWKGAMRAGKEGARFSKRLHQSQKPVALMLWCMDYARIGMDKKVCDPYMGSGSTGIACLRSGRRFLGIEIDRNNFDIACERIEREQRQARLSV